MNDSWDRHDHVCQECVVMCVMIACVGCTTTIVCVDECVCWRLTWIRCDSVTHYGYCVTGNHTLWQDMTRYGSWTCNITHTHMMDTHYGHSLRILCDVTHCGYSSRWPSHSMDTHYGYIGMCGVHIAWNMWCTVTHYAVCVTGRLTLSQDMTGYG